MDIFLCCCSVAACSILWWYHLRIILKRAFRKAFILSCIAGNMFSCFVILSYLLLDVQFDGPVSRPRVIIEIYVAGSFLVSFIIGSAFAARIPVEKKKPEENVKRNDQH